MNNNELAPAFVYKEERAPAAEPATLGREEAFAVPAALEQKTTTYASRGKITGAIKAPKKEATTFAPPIKRNLNKEWWGLRHIYKAIVNVPAAAWDVVAYPSRFGKRKGGKEKRLSEKSFAGGLGTGSMWFLYFVSVGLIPAYVFTHRIGSGKKTNLWLGKQN